MSAADLTTQSPHFYWYNGTFTGDSKEVSVVVTIAGTPITLKGKCKVYRPKFNSFTGTYTTNNPAVQKTNGTFKLGAPGAPGMTWNANVETPNVAVASGTVAFEQLVTLSNIAQGTQNGVSYVQKQNATDALDSPDNDPIYSPNDATGSRRAITPGSVINLIDNDSPDVPPIITDNSVQGSESFTTYLVYQPSGAGSIWVVLGRLSWSFGFNATYDNNALPFPRWVVTTTSPTGTTTNPVGTDTYDFPIWSTRGQDVKWIKETP